MRHDEQTHEHGAGGRGGEEALGAWMPDAVPWAAVPFLLAGALYAFCVLLSMRGSRPWPLLRLVSWLAGLGLAMAAAAGPLAQLAHLSFTAHMAVHLLLGMAAPLLLMYGAPVTLALRTLGVRQARRVTAVLRSRPLRVLTDPAAAAVLNIGGLWALYGTDLYALMHTNIAVRILVHIHLLFAGYLFTASMVGLDHDPHRRSFVYRSCVLLTALATHNILAKHLYAHPPDGVPDGQAEAGAMLMYYGGDAVHMALIAGFCLQWYKATWPRTPVPVPE